MAVATTIDTSTPNPLDTVFSESGAELVAAALRFAPQRRGIATIAGLGDNVQARRHFDK